MRRQADLLLGRDAALKNHRTVSVAPPRSIIGWSNRSTASVTMK